MPAITAKDFFFHSRNHKRKWIPGNYLRWIVDHKFGGWQFAKRARKFESFKFLFLCRCFAITFFFHIPMITVISALFVCMSTCSLYQSIQINTFNVNWYGRGYAWRESKTFRVVYSQDPRENACALRHLQANTAKALKACESFATSLHALPQANFLQNTTTTTTRAILLWANNIFVVPNFRVFIRSWTFNNSSYVECWDLRRS